MRRIFRCSLLGLMANIATTWPPERSYGGRWLRSLEQRTCGVHEQEQLSGRMNQKPSTDVKLGGAVCQWRASGAGPCPHDRGRERDGLWFVRAEEDGGTTRE
jgi:hypothetical protein